VADHVNIFRVVRPSDHPIPVQFGFIVLLLVTCPIQNRSSIITAGTGKTVSGEKSRVNKAYSREKVSLYCWSGQLCLLVERDCFGYPREKISFRGTWFKFLSKHQLY
jgi:hypothetical protein